MELSRESLENLTRRNTLTCRNVNSNSKAQLVCVNVKFKQKYLQLVYRLGNISSRILSGVGSQISKEMVCKLALNNCINTRKNEELNQSCQELVASYSQQLAPMLCCTLLTTVVNNHCSRLLTVNNIVQSLLTTMNKLVSSTIVGSCFSNIVTTIVLRQHRTYSSTLSIQQALFKLDNNIVQALFSDQRDQFWRVQVINYYPEYN